MEVRQTADTQKGLDSGHIKKVDDLHGRFDVSLLIQEELPHREIVMIEQQRITFVQKEIKELVETIE